MDQRRIEESRQVTALMILALSFIGATAAISAFAAWMSTAVLAPGLAPVRAGVYVTEAVARMRGRRQAAREVSIAAYRLVMALRTGSTLAVDGMHEGGRTTLQQLRREFHDTIAEHAPQALQGDAEAPALPEVGDEAAEPSTGDVTPDDHVPGEVLWEDASEEEIPHWDLDDWTDDAEIEAELARLADEDAAEDAEWEELVRAELERLAAEEYRERLKQAQEEARQRQEDQDAAREEERRKMGRRLGFIEDKHVRNGGRGATDEMLEHDSKVVGVARYSPGGCCAFCGILMLNGPHYKKPYPKLKVHNNCDCQHIPLYSASEYDSDSRFNWNRYMEVAYKEGAPNRNSKRNSNEGLNALRRHLYQRRKLARS